MKPFIRLLLVFCASVATAPLVRATDPPAARGHVLVLDNDRILEGDAEKVGDQYRVHGAGGETWLPAAKVRCLCADLNAAYRYLRGDANLHDADERLRLARFCLLHGLHAQARDEAAAALEMRPNSPECRRLFEAAKQSEAAPAHAAAPAGAAAADCPAAMPNIDTAAYGQFVNRVQPVLMNACANCHATGRGGSFKLARTFTEGGLTNRRATQQNLTAVLGMLNRDRPLDSPLLTHALTMHGTAEKPPLKGKAEPAYKSLEDWVQFALTTTAHDVPAAPIAVPEPKPAPPLATEKTAPTPPAITEKTAPPAVTEAKPSEPPARPVPAVNDPYDPAQFNRQAHPDGN